MYEDVVARLASLGYPPEDTAQTGIQYAIDRAEWTIKNNINQTAMPAGLRFVWIDMATGLYLSDLKAAGQLTDFETPVKTISEGDTSVTFVGVNDGVLSPEAQFDKLLHDMVNPSQEQLAAYRRMKW